MVHQKQQKKLKKGEQAPSLPNLGNGDLKTTKQNKTKEGASSSFVKSWRWRCKNNKKKPIKT
jgi:hypothetical protein